MKKNFTFPFLLLVLFITSNAQAQQLSGSVKGIVRDSATKKPVEFMTMALKKDNIAIKTVVTTTTGAFNFEKTVPGKYILSAIAIGYNIKSTTVTVTAGKNTELGNLLVTAQTNNLKEVSVSAERPLIKQEVDRISYDTQADPESKVLTALDMMRKVPLLSLDADDNIKLKGSGNYKIFINGKPSSMVARSPKDVLRSMPASSIQKIEVITTPPAKYDSEGLSGIINIVTSKKIDNGYNGSLNLRGQGPVGGPGLGGSVTVKQNKLGISAYGGLGNYNQPETQTTNNRTTTGAVPTTLYNTTFRKTKNRNMYGGAELSYEIDTLNLLTAEIMPYTGFFQSDNNQLFRQNDGSKDISYDVLGRSRFDWDGFDASLNYQLGFKSNKERMLTFSYKYSNSTEPQEDNLAFINRYNFNDPDYTQNNESKSKEQTLQVDYVHPVKKLNIEGGLKAILRDNNSIFEYRSLDNNTGGYLIDPSRTNAFNNNQDVYGAYNSYTLNLKDWGFKAGVRLEETKVKANFISSGSNVNTDYTNVIPSVSVNHKFKDMSNLNLGFTQRIQRPGIYNLNPFVDRSTPNFESTGNPDLKAVLSNNIDLSYSKFKKGSINIGLSYSFANNTIQNVSAYDEQTGITRTSYFNIGKDKNLGTNLNVSYPITDKWNASLSGNFGYIWLEGTIDGGLTKNDGVTGYGYLNTGYKFGHEWRANASFSYSAPSVLLQGKSGSYNYMSFSGSKEVIKEKLTVTLAINNPFTKYRYYTTYTEGPNFRQEYRGQNYSRSFNASLNWKFGKLKGAIKKSQRSISNDDVKSGGKSGG